MKLFRFYEQPITSSRILAERICQLMDDDEVRTCAICGGTPCEWEELGEGIVVIAGPLKKKLQEQ